jgi:Fe-S-cluster containining protein
MSCERNAVELIPRMPGNNTPPTNALYDAVRAASPRSEARTAVEQVYQDLAAQVEERRPFCIVSGRCCRFEEYGHRLYVTTLELATFLHGFDTLSKPAPLTTSIENWDGIGCPFQVAKLCGVHTLRPFGCRIYFCDATSTQWQQEAYEVFHGRLKRLHEELAVPYFYVEWRQALRALLPLPTPSPVEE